MGSPSHETLGDLILTVWFIGYNVWPLPLGSNKVLFTWLEVIKYSISDRGFRLSHFRRRSSTVGYLYLFVFSSDQQGPCAVESAFLLTKQGTIRLANLMYWFKQRIMMCVLATGVSMHASNTVIHLSGGPEYIRTSGFGRFAFQRKRRTQLRVVYCLILLC